MKKKGFTLVEIMIVVAIIALLAAIAIPNLLTAKRTANDSAAAANLRTLSTAAETYASANSGTYPDTTAKLAAYATSASTLCGATVQGYTYACTLATTGYTITAQAATCGTSGSKDYSVTTGAALTSADCS